MYGSAADPCISLGRKAILDEIMANETTIVRAEIAWAEQDLGLTPGGNRYWAKRDVVNRLNYLNSYAVIVSLVPAIPPPLDPLGPPPDPSDPPAAPR